MTPTTLQSSPSLSRRVGWLVMACAAASLALTIVVRTSGGSVRWTAWALPLLLAANTDVFFFGRLNGRPRAARLFMFCSLGLAVAIIISETLTLVRR